MIVVQTNTIPNTETITRTAFTTRTVTEATTIPVYTVITTTTTSVSTRMLTATTTTTATNTKYETSVVTSISTLTMVVQTTKCGPGGAVQTPPSGTYPGMIEGCTEFYRVREGETCDSIARKFGITRAIFIRWNSYVGSDCGRLYPDFYACVNV